MDSLFLSLDLHGHDVALNYRGEPSFKTRLGACLTVISVTLLVAYASYRLTVGGMLSVASSTRIADLDQLGYVNFEEHSFDVMFGFYR